MSEEQKNAVRSADDYPADPQGVMAPPHTLGGILRRIGPGLILAGSIVGSGELIATTRTGAEAGFTLLWLIIIGCIIKVFVQIELGRYTLISGKTTLMGLNDVPGPEAEVALGRRRMRGNWITWFWLLMFLATIAQLGGIVGGVGQALAISWPLTSEGRTYNAALNDKVELQVSLSELQIAAGVEVDDLHETSPAEQYTRLVAQRGALLLKLAGEEDADKRDKAKAKLAVADAKLAKLTADEQAASLKAVDETIAKKTDQIASLTTSVRPYIDRVVTHREYKQASAELKKLRGALSPEDHTIAAREARKKIAELEPKVASLNQSLQSLGGDPPQLHDDKYWAAIIAAITIVMLVTGRYGFIEVFSTILVGAFTLITIGNLISLQSYSQWAVKWGELQQGLSFGLPELTAAQKLAGKAPLTTALATFGIIGVGASELMAYPYWCMEKGYARWTGPHDQSADWAERARGWMRVMHWDAWGSMVLYTFATVAFYLLGAAILNRTGLEPEGTDTIRTLAVMYQPVFGHAAQLLFLFGAIAVLYSTFFVANAANSRLAADVIDAFKIAPLNDQSRKRWVRLFGALFPATCVLIYTVIPAPVVLILLSGVMQALLLPIPASAALYSRYKHCDKRLRPSPIWDAFLWLSFIGFLIVGLYLTWVKLFV